MTNGHFTGIQPLIDTLVCNPSCACGEGICDLPTNDVTTIRMNFRRGPLLLSPVPRQVAKIFLDSSGNSEASPTRVIASGVWAVGANLQLRPIANTVSACTAPQEPFVCCTGANTGGSEWPCGPREIVPTRLPEPGQFWQLLSGLAGLGGLYRLRGRS
jgi:hypothetical protein